MTGLAVRARISGRGFDLGFDVAPGEVLAVLGPNGAGKSTALQVVAGLLRPDSGSVRLGDRALTDTDSGIFVPPHARRVGLLPQDALLFPHMDVLGNVGFAARCQGRGRREARTLARHWLGHVDAEELADRRPHQLSGGQAQRVAIARALAGRPEVLLLDEPLAGLDVAAAAAIRTLLRGVLAEDGRSAVVVTHDLLDVLTLADRVLVLEAGEIAEQGPVASVLGAPRSPFAARLAGVNLVNGTIEAESVLRTAEGERWHGLAADPLSVGAPAVALFSPAAVAVHVEPPAGSPRNVIKLTVAELDARGTAIRLRGATQADGAPGLAADITPNSAAGLGLTAGAPVWFAVKAQEVSLHATHRGPTADAADARRP